MNDNIIPFNKFKQAKNKHVLGTQDEMRRFAELEDRKDLSKEEIVEYYSLQGKFKKFGEAYNELQNGIRYADSLKTKGRNMDKIVPKNINDEEQLRKKRIELFDKAREIEENEARKYNEIMEKYYPDFLNEE